MDHEILIPAVVFGTIALIIKIILDHRVRQKLIDKNMLDENVKFLKMNTAPESNLSSMKWGMVLVAVGLAFLIGRFAPSDIAHEVTLGCMFILAGISLLAFYAVAEKMQKKGQNPKK
ncbi:hypothetical protein JW906_15330 [bacterium]|nr:hypothetical protein [bacterium]